MQSIWVFSYLCAPSACVGTTFRIFVKIFIACFFQLAEVEYARDWNMCSISLLPNTVGLFSLQGIDLVLTNSSMCCSGKSSFKGAVLQPAVGTPDVGQSPVTCSSMATGGIWLFPGLGLCLAAPVPWTLGQQIPSDPWDHELRCFQGQWLVFGCWTVNRFASQQEAAALSCVVPVGAGRAVCVKNVAKSSIQLNPSERNLVALQRAGVSGKGGRIAKPGQIPKAARRIVQ